MSVVNVDIAISRNPEGIKLTLPISVLCTFRKNFIITHIVITLRLTGLLFFSSYFVCLSYCVFFLRKRLQQAGLAIHNITTSLWPTFPYDTTYFYFPFLTTYPVSQLLEQGCHSLYIYGDINIYLL